MTFSIRDARPDDAGTILQFITDLAVFEKAGHEVEATVESLTASIFGQGSVTRAVILESGDKPAGFAIWFYNYSTWQAKKGLYLEDLYIDPAYRGSGAGKLVLRHLAKVAVAEGCGRFEWSVLDWNEPAIRVYDAIGAEPQNEWIRYRMTGEKLKAFAAG